MTSLRQCADALLAALVAPPCAICGRELESPLDGAVCEPCWQAVVRTGSRFSLPAIPAARAVGPYEGTLREIIHALKYDHRRSVAPRLSRMMIEHGSDVLDGADLIVAVPLHWRRRRQRGFNQAADLARGLGLPVRRALRRVRHTTPQVELPAEDRQSNIQGAFAVRAWPFTHSLRPESACSLADATIVLVDDVTTTGATLVACARTLRMAGAREIRALTAARAESAPRAARPR